MKNEEAIAILEESKRQNEIMRDNPTTFWKSSDTEAGIENAKKRIEALDAAISALRSAEKCDQNAAKMRPGCNPLTLAQLREMVDEPAYLYMYDTALDSGWHIIKAVTEDKIIFRGWNTVYVPVSSLGRCFDLYAYPPAHIDREAWEPCGRCKSCGNCNEAGKEMGEKINYAHPCHSCLNEDNFKPVAFCRYCGRPLTPEAWAELEKRMGVRA